MKILVTGAGGFIGRHVTELFHQRSHEVVPHEHAKDGELAESWIPSGVEAVVNCAGRLGGQGAGMEEMRRANVELPRLLGEFCAGSGVPMIHLSTPGVTGLRPSASEDDPLDPWGDYEITKAEAERILFELLPSEQLTVLRPDFVYGPGDLHKLTLFKQVARGWFPLIGMGRARLRPTFVLDVCRAVAMSLPKGPLQGGLFNIGGPEVIPVGGLVEALGRSLERRVLRLPVPKILLRSFLLLGPLCPSALSASRIRLFGEDHYVSINRAKAAGFAPRVELEDGLKATVAWYRTGKLL